MLFFQPVGVEVSAAQKEAETYDLSLQTNDVPLLPVQLPTPKIAFDQEGCSQYLPSLI
jgi:hypothetical protein